MHKMCNDQVRVFGVPITSSFYRVYVLGTFEVLPSGYFEIYNTLLLPSSATEYQNLSNSMFVPINQPFFFLPCSHLYTFPSLWYLSSILYLH